MEKLGEAVAGGAAGVFSLLATYPLSVAKTRLQAQRKAERRRSLSQDLGKGVVDKADLGQVAPEKEDPQTRYRNALDCLVKIARLEGIVGLFSGVRSSIPKAFLTNFIFYYVNAVVKPLLARLCKGNKLLAATLQGIIAGTVVQLIMTPVEMINTRVIVSVKSKDGFKKGFRATLREVVREEGFLSLYKGIWPQLVLTVNPGITSAVRQTLVPAADQASAARNFWAGAGSKAVASMTTYPIVIAKVFMFTQAKTSASEDRMTIPNVLAKIVREEGAAGLYKGSEVQVSNAVIKEALLNMARHPINTFIMGFFRPSGESMPPH